MENTRIERLAAALETEFQQCHSLLSGALAHIENSGTFQDWQMRNLAQLMRTTVQLAGVINRLEGKPAPKNSENAGSIPQ